MISYILESSVCLACFYGFYWLFLRKEKLLSINRFYLLITALLSVVIPLLNLGIRPSLVNGIEILSSEIPTQSLTLSGAELGTSSFSYLQLTYILGLTAAFGLLIVKLFMVRNRVRKWFSAKKSHVEVIESDQPEAFSFLSTIFISKSLNEDDNLKQQVIAHEEAHIKGRHSLDLIFFELVKCFYWFNPFSYFYSKSIRLQHEYIADQSALMHTDAKTYERSLLQLTLSKVNTDLVSGFNEHPIQKRLKMIQKLNSNVMNKFRPLFALPVLSVLFIAFACTDEISPESIVEEMEIPADQNLNVYTEILDGMSGKLELIIDSLNNVEGEKEVFVYKLRVEQELEIPLDESKNNDFTLWEFTSGEKPDIHLEFKDKSNNDFIEIPAKKH